MEAGDCELFDAKMETGTTCLCCTLYIVDIVQDHLCVAVPRYAGELGIYIYIENSSAPIVVVRSNFN